MKAMYLVSTLFFILLGGAAQGANITVFDYNTSWKYVLGTSEASVPASAWRAVVFNDAAWSTGPAPIGYDTAGTPGTTLPIATTTPTSSVGNFLSIYFRKTFVITNLGDITSVSLAINVDDGAVAWINGT